jgi:hypothetical protein
VYARVTPKVIKRISTTARSRWLKARAFLREGLGVCARTVLEIEEFLRLVDELFGAMATPRSSRYLGALYRKEHVDLVIWYSTNSSRRCGRCLGGVVR